ncbi:MAG: TrbC/VirB2 family protein [Clostridia bacterium]|nr:TrbC/VirB2 family protein [Clostridia bacterium]
MKKAIKIIAVLLVACTLFFTVAQPVALADSAVDITGKLTTEKNVGTDDMTEIGSKIMSFIWVLSIIVAVVVLMYTGLKFIVGSANEKAEYKKSLMPLVVGVLILVFATTIINALFSIKS